MQGIEKYSRFVEKFGKGIRYSDILISEINEYDQFLMIDEILDFLSTEGISSYNEGYLWTLNPNDFTEVLNDILPFEERCIPFARSAFGDMLFLREKNIYVLNTSSGFMSLLTDDFDLFVNRYLTDDWFYTTFFNGDLFNELLKNDISHDECMGFDPVLSEGGIRDVTSLKNLKLHEYLESVSKSSIKIEFYKH